MSTWKTKLSLQLKETVSQEYKKKHPRKRKLDFLVIPTEEVDESILINEEKKHGGKTFQKKKRVKTCIDLTETISITNVGTWPEEISPQELDDALSRPGSLELIQQTKKKPFLLQILQDAKHFVLEYQHLKILEKHGLLKNFTSEQQIEIFTFCFDNVDFMYYQIMYFILYFSKYFISSSISFPQIWKKGYENFIHNNYDSIDNNDKDFFTQTINKLNTFY